jgi:hypothetical protein
MHERFLNNFENRSNWCQELFRKSSIYKKMLSKYNKLIFGKMFKFEKMMIIRNNNNDKPSYMLP